MSMEKSESGLGAIGAIIILFNCTIGAALLNLPASIISAGGFFNGYICFVVMLFISVASAVAIAWSVEAYGCESYQDMVGTYFGSWGRLLLEIQLILFTLFVCMYIQTGIADEIERLLLDTIDRDYYCENWFVRRDFATIIFTLLVIVPPSVASTMKELRWASFFAILALTCIILSVIYVSSTTPNVDSSTIPTSPKSLKDFVMAFPGIVLAYSNQFPVVSMYVELKHRSVFRLFWIYAIATVLSTACYAIASYFAVITFGSEISENFILSFDSSSFLVRFALILYGFKLGLEYPVVQYIAWVCFQTISYRVFGISSLEWRWRFLSSLLWCTGVVVATIYFNNLIFFSPFVGILAMLISFVVPGMTLMSATTSVRKDIGGISVIQSILQYFTGIFLFVFGALISGIIIFSVDTFMETAMEVHNDDPCSNYTATLFQQS